MSVGDTAGLVVGDDAGTQPLRDCPEPFWVGLDCGITLPTAFVALALGPDDVGGAGGAGGSGNRSSGSGAGAGSSNDTSKPAISARACS